MWLLLKKSRETCGHGESCMEFQYAHTFNPKDWDDVTPVPIFESKEDALRFKKEYDIFSDYKPVEIPIYRK